MSSITDTGFFSDVQTKGAPFDDIEDGVQSLDLQDKPLFDRGMKMATNRFLAARILCLSSVIAAIAVAIFFSPYMALVALPLGGYGIYMWSCADNIREFRLRNKEIVEHLNECFKQTLNVGASQDTLTEIQQAVKDQNSFLNEFRPVNKPQIESIKKKIEVALEIFKTCEDRMGDMLKVWNLNNLNTSNFNKNFEDSFVAHRLGCNRAYQLMFTAGSKDALALGEYLVNISDLKKDILDLHLFTCNLFKEFLSQNTFRLL